MTFIAGAYTATYTPGGGSLASIGQTEKGFTIRETPHYEPIHTDEGGDVELDGVLRGMSCEVELDYAEYDLIKPCLYNAASQGQALSNVGKLATGLAGPLVLTPVAGTTAKTLDGTKVYTFLKAIVLTDIETMLRNGLRTGRVVFRCFPDSGTSNKTYTWA